MMPNDALIDRLSADLRPVRPRQARRDLTLVLLVLLAELAAFLVFGHRRHDLAEAVTDPAFLWKTGCLLALGGLGIAASLTGFHPTGNPRRLLRVAACMAGLALLLGAGVEWHHPLPGGLTERLAWSAGLECLKIVLILAVPPTLGLGLLMRRGAATDPAGTALAAGLAGGAAGALLFCLHCPSDDPLYITVWYGSGCLLVLVACRLLLPPLTRW